MADSNSLPVQTDKVWFGLFLPQVRMDFATVLTRTSAAEVAGFDSVWLIDHLATPANNQLDLLEGWTLAAALAARTEQIRIGHLVTSDPFRHPAVLAKMVATVDNIANGRLDLGLGWGSMAEELRAFGVSEEPNKLRSSRLRETLEILSLMFSGEQFDYSGTHYQLHGARGVPKPQQNPVPIHIGGGGPQLTMPLVRDFAHWWNCPSYAVDRLDELTPLAGEAQISVQHPVGLAHDESDREKVIARAERRFGTWGGLISGTPSEVTDALRAEVAKGVRGFVLQFDDFGTPETVARFMNEVAPEVQAGVGA